MSKLEAKRVKFVAHDLSTPMVAKLKRRYLESLTEPLDGMWDTGFINNSPHWTIEVDRVVVGYFSVSEQGVLHQFFVKPEFESNNRCLFDEVIAQDSIKSAVAFTLDLPFLTLCLDAQTNVKVQTLLYQQSTRGEGERLAIDVDEMGFRQLEASELEQCIAFQQACLNQGDLRDWLHGYSTNLIERRELYVAEQQGKWVALGECRKSDTQEGVFDLGFMVSPGSRGKGIGTSVLKRLAGVVTGYGGKAICSTTVDNIGARKAIERSGFVCRHRILDITFGS